MILKRRKRSALFRLEAEDYSVSTVGGRAKGITVVIGEVVAKHTTHFSILSLGLQLVFLVPLQRLQKHIYSCCVRRIAVYSFKREPGSLKLFGGRRACNAKELKSPTSQTRIWRDMLSLLSTFTLRTLISSTRSPVPC